MPSRDGAALFATETGFSTPARIGRQKTGRGAVACLQTGGPPCKIEPACRLRHLSKGPRQPSTASSTRWR